MARTRKAGARTRPAPHPFAGKRPRGISLEAVSAFVGGIGTASGADAVIADSGAMAAGDYKVIGHMGDDGIAAAGKGCSLVHRNAANSADVKQLAACPASESATVNIPRLTLAANERIVLRASTVIHAAIERVIGSIELIAIPS